jgi:hypothetical protein
VGDGGVRGGVADSDPEPGPVLSQGLDDQKLKKFKAEKSRFF